MKGKALVISALLGYKNVNHAGGKINYYYLKKVEDVYDLTIMTRIRPGENEKIKDDGIKADYISVKYKNIFLDILGALYSLLTFNVYFFFCRYSFTFFAYRELLKLKKSGYSPDIVFLDWTECIFLIKKLRKLFPCATFSGCEQDVTFLSFSRKMEFFKGSKKLLSYFEFLIMRRREIKALNKCDLVLVLNHKDKKLLEDSKIFKGNLKVISPYYDNFSYIERLPEKHSIIFYGAMNRMENYESVKYFIEEVFYKLPENFTFTVVGSKPHESLLKYESNRIHFTGFVENVAPYFSSALCMVVPLVLGAGIKIKVLESFSAGLPILTNDIGIEGIPAVNNKDYIHCNTSDDYISSILFLSNNLDKAIEIGKNAKIFVAENFNMEKDSYI